MAVIHDVFCSGAPMHFLSGVTGCGLKDVRAFIEGLYDRGLHAKRVGSLAAATLGVMTGASRAVAMIGQALAEARGLATKHVIKQVDRLLSNGGIDVWQSFARWVPHIVTSREQIMVAKEWTDFDADDQATLALNLVTDPSRSRLRRPQAVRPSR